MASLIYGHVNVARYIYRPTFLKGHRVEVALVTNLLINQWYGNGNLVVLGVTTVTSVCHHQYAGKHQPSAQSKFEVENF